MKTFPIPRDVRADFASRFDSTHEGIDIFAAHGSPVLAVADGRVRFEVEPKGGNVAYLTEPNGNRYYYAHLDRFEGQGLPRLVRAGDVIGYVGTTGNAQGREPHVHFEYRPLGGAKVDPFPELDRVLQVPVTTTAPKVRTEPKPRQKAPEGDWGKAAFFAFVAYTLLKGG